MDMEETDMQDDMDIDVESNSNEYLGSYMMEWAKLRKCLDVSDMQYTWLLSMRVEVLEVLETTCCRHHNPMSTVKLDCFHPKDEAIVADRQMMKEYSVVKNRLEKADFQHVELPLCDLCTGLRWDPVMQLSEHSIFAFLKSQEEWRRWIHLCQTYQMVLPRVPVSRLDYCTLFKAKGVNDENENVFFYEPRDGAKTLQERTVDGSSFEYKEKKRSEFLEPYQWHAVYWICCFLHEILWRHYDSVERIQSEKKNAKECRRWAQIQARKFKPNHDIWKALSPLGHEVKNVDMFIGIMRQFFVEKAPRTQNDIFGFYGLKTADIDLQGIAVELANVVANLLPQTRWMKRARPQGVQESSER